MKELILGGVRSGKSRLAEQHALATGLPVTYIATATAEDEEMRVRIAHHQAHRPAQWYLIEEPIALAAALQKIARKDHCILVDCLTLWLTNLLCVENETRMQQEVSALLQTLPDLPGHIILVSNETGMGVVPLGELTRRYCDEAGRLHQALALSCERVILTVAGLPLHLKG
jgi:adenosylcobinamide kinase/adenosylcobinamide-phosphate guanylyltransferase